MGEHFKIEELALKLKVSQDTIRRRMKEIPDLEVVLVGRLIRIPDDQAQRLVRRVQKYAKPK